jgi:hypothetical protein
MNEKVPRHHNLFCLTCLLNSCINSLVFVESSGFLSTRILPEYLGNLKASPKFFRIRP